MGILPDSMIQAMVNGGEIIPAQPLDLDQIQPASMDIRLGEVGYRIRASFLPGSGQKVGDKLYRYKLHEIDLRDGAVLETGCVYLIPVLESLALADDISASANPKSSTGRLDIFTRVIVDGSQAFDQVPKGYKGQLYLEVSPSTFPIVVRKGSRLAQIRFRKGASLLNETELKHLHDNCTLISGGHPIFHADGIGISIDLAGDPKGLVGYRGKRHTGVIDVDQKEGQRMVDYWDPIFDHGSGELVLDPGEFYILVSKEAVHIPPDYAAEMVAYDTHVGEFRVHYAGFFDPGFGHVAAGGSGSRAVLEVRSHDVPFIVEHGQLVGRLVYESMISRPENLYGQDLGSNYQAQGLKLSKHFRTN